MKRSIKSLIGFTIGATDGEIGKVKEFFFDDKSWMVRYVVVETGSWLNGRKVLLSPQALLAPDWENGVFPVDLSKEKIRNSPDIDTEQTVSRQHEIEMYEYYPWTKYWGGGIWGGGMDVSGLMSEVHEPLIELAGNNSGTDTKDADGDPHLRSTRSVTGYAIRATDGKIGNVADFIIDDHTWRLHFIVGDTGHWFPGKQVLIFPGLIEKIEWDTSEVILNVTELDVKESPEYEQIEISETYQASLQHYYADLIEDIY